MFEMMLVRNPTNKIRGMDFLYEINYLAFNLKKEILAKYVSYMIDSSSVDIRDVVRIDNMKKVIIYFSDISKTKSPFKLYYSDTPFDVDDLPEQHIDCSAGQESVELTFEDDEDVLYLRTMTSHSEKTIPGRLTLVYKDPDTQIEKLLPSEAEILVYFNADNSTTEYADYVFKDDIVRGVYEGTLTIVQEDGRRWIKPNGDGILRFPEPLLVNDDLTILALVKPPTKPTGTTYSISDVITGSYVSSSIDDVLLGFGGNGTTLDYEKDGMRNTIYLNDFSLLNNPKRAMTIYAYIPKAIGYSKEIILSNSETGKVKHLDTQRKIFRSRLEGILGGYRGGRYGREGLIRSVLIIKGELDEPRLDAIAEFMGQI